VRAAEDFDVEASRATKPYFYRAPVPERLPNNMHVMEFQLAGAEYCVPRDNALIGDAPGLTKTAQSIIIGNAIAAKKTLVICPASLRLNWEREIWSWSTRPNVSTYPVLTAAYGISNQADYVIVSWALLANEAIHKAIMAERWDHVIPDEAHALKDPKGNQRTKAFVGWNDHGTYRSGIVDVCGRITALSGTLLPNQPIEAYNLVRLLKWDAIDRASLEDFRNYYYDKGGGLVRGPVLDRKTMVWTNKLHWSDEVRNVPRNMDDLQYRLRKHVMVRRLKEDVLKELPPKTWHPFPLVMTAAIRSAMKHPGWGEASRLYEMNPDAFNRGVPVDGAISTARLLLGEAKAPSVADYIEDLLGGGVTKLVVAGWHHTVLKYLRERLTKHGLVYMDGSTSTKAKQAAVDDFQNNPKTTIILGQMLPLGEGWTLTAAQDAVLAEFDWVPGKNDQLLDRIHRMGQKGNYLIGHIPVVPGTLDERMLSTAIDKDIHIHKALDKRH